MFAIRTCVTLMPNCYPYIQATTKLCFQKANIHDKLTRNYSKFLITYNTNSTSFPLFFVSAVGSISVFFLSDSLTVTCNVFFELRDCSRP